MRVGWANPAVREGVMNWKHDLAGLAVVILIVGLVCLWGYAMAVAVDIDERRKARAERMRTRVEVWSA